MLGTFPANCPGGQRQRVAIARALVREPKLILADEPTAALDKESGREVVELMRRLAKQQGCSVVLVTHDNRILDIADRMIHMEAGRLSSFTSGALANSSCFLDLVAQNNRQGALLRQVQEMPEQQFSQLLESTTADFHQFLRAFDLRNHAAFEALLDQVLEAFTLKAGQLVGADCATLFLVDAKRGELWSKVAQGDAGSVEIRLPLGRGIAGEVVRTGKARNVPDAYADALFHRDVDEATGYRTRTVLCAPVCGRAGSVIGAVQLLNKHGGPFNRKDEERLAAFAGALAPVLETWRRMREEVGSTGPPEARP